MPSWWYAAGAVAHWRGVVAPGAQSVYEGTYWDPVTRTYATVTRSTSATIYDPVLRRIFDVRAGFIPQCCWSCSYPGGRGYAPVIEEARTNALAYSYFTSQADVNQWTMDASGTATVGTAGLYTGSKGVTLVADASGNRAFWRTFTSTAVARMVSARVYTNGAAVTSADMQLCAAAGSSTPVGTLLTTTFTALGGGWYRATAPYTGTAATWAAGIAVKAGKTVFADALQEEIGASATSYIPTTAAAATRDACVVTEPTTGWSAAAGTLVAVAMPEVASGIARALVGIAGTSGTNNALGFGISSAGAATVLDFAGANGGWVSPTAGAAVASVPAVYAATYGSLKCRAYKNGTGGTELDTDDANGIAATAYLGANRLGVPSCNGPIPQLVVFSTALTAAQVLALNSLLSGIAPSRIPALMAAGVIR
ncbi:MAG: hypothetical protein WC700_14580 [Gemmatimonadaceae bacterium]|jgi:hypothetical protein